MWHPIWNWIFFKLDRYDPVPSLTIPLRETIDRFNWFTSTKHKSEYDPARIRCATSILTSCWNPKTQCTVIPFYLGVMENSHPLWTKIQTRNYRLLVECHGLKAFLDNYEQFLGIKRQTVRFQNPWMNFAYSIRKKTSISVASAGKTLVSQMASLF